MKDGNNTVVLLLMLIVAMAACGRKGPNLSGLETRCFYVAQCDDRDVVLYVDSVTENFVMGRWYSEGEYFAKPHCFKAAMGMLHREKMESDSLVIKPNAMPGGDTLVLDMLIDESWRTLCFLPWRQPPVMDINRDYPYYYDELFEVDVDSVVYGYAVGFWASYPEPEYDCDQYLQILMEKWTDKEEMTLKDLELDMDIYRPITDDTKPRPLLMLIHGGAFFNGDKRAMGYKEWGHYFASRGYVVASINYRLGFKARGSKRIDRAGYRAVQDAYAAMCYLLRHPERYPIDPNYLFVAGSSAGAITALNLAFMTDYDRPKSTEAGPINQGYNKRHKRNNNHKDVGLEDLGGIDTVAKINGGSVDFNINTVVNMWGAVHEIKMIDTTSPGTAILSFHGDADETVAYGHDYPFANLDPVNRIMCNRMYGSKCIHERAIGNGRVSELHTVKGGGHSLHVTDCVELSDYYTLITDTTTQFLFYRMFPRPIINKMYVGRQQWFEIDNAGDLKTCRWEAEGGLVLEAESDKARVVFFGEEPEHKIRIVGQKKNNEGYDEVYVIE